MVSVKFLGCVCFIQPLLSSYHSINHCFDDTLEQQGVSRKKLHMHINPKYFNNVQLNGVCDKHFQITGKSRRN